MAQTSKATSKSSKARTNSKTKASSSSKGTASKRYNPSSSTKRASANGSRAKRSTASRPRAQSRSSAPSRNGSDSFKGTAKGVGQTVADAASKAKTPLIAGGTALAGVAAGAVLKSRMNNKSSKNPLKRLSGVSMPKPDLSGLDLDTIKSTAERVSAYGKQVSDIAAAAEKTHKKNK